MVDGIRRWILISGLCLLLLGCVLVVPRPEPTVPPVPTATPAEQEPSTPTAMPQATPTVWPIDSLELYRQAMRPGFAGDIDRFVNATRYAIDVQFDLATLTLNGTEWVRYTNQESEPLTEIVFRLLPSTPGYGALMQVRSVSLEDTDVSFTVELDGSAVRVPLSTPLAPGQAVDLYLDFESTLPGDTSAGYAQYGYIDGVLAVPNAYPMIPVYDDEGWNVELAPTYGDATFADTSLYVVRATLPADMLPATSGVIVERQENGDGTVTYTCVSGPMRDFNLVASAAYQTVNTQVGEVLVTSFYLPGDQKGGERALDYAAQSLRIYQQLFGPYPFTELDVTATPTEAGGIEYPGLIVVADGLYGRTGGFFEFATVHEVAHQWWYSLVGNDQLDEPWLDEALTQYSSLLYFEERYGQEQAQQILENSFEAPYRRLQELEQDVPAGLPVVAYTAEQYGPAVYGKGPLFFHEMRQQVGNEVFYEILRVYFERYRYGVAYPQDLMAVAEQVSGQSLDSLYERWIAGD